MQVIKKLSDFKQKENEMMKKIPIRNAKHKKKDNLNT